MTGYIRVLEFFASGVGASTATRIKVLQPAPNRCSFLKERRRAGVWSRSSGIRPGMLKVCLRRQRSVERMMSQRIDFPKFHLRLMKLSQIQLRRGTCEFGVPHLRLAGAGIISWPFSVLASPGRRSLEIVVAGIFWSTSTTSRPLLIQVLGFFQDFSDTSFAHGAPSRDAEGRWC